MGTASLFDRVLKQELNIHAAWLPVMDGGPRLFNPYPARRAPTLCATRRTRERGADEANAPRVP
jgi:hypothetical protein